MVQTTVWNALKKGPLRVSVIGSGNWGTAVARILAQNVYKSYVFHDEVRMWVHEEEWQGRNLSEIINSDHTNPKYLPGIQLPKNIKACTDIRDAISDANLLVFVLPHQFLKSVCQLMKGHVPPLCRGVTLVKGIITEENRVVLVSEYITQQLGLQMSCLSGANVALNIAREEFSEATIGYQKGDEESAHYLQQLFDTPYFKVDAIPDVAGVEFCGALKNIVALGAGFVDGLQLGSNTKAAILRLGMKEMKLFARVFRAGILEETFWESAGMADVITTCYGGRNRKCAEAFVKTGKSWETLENELLGGQKLQGVPTCEEVYQVISMHNLQSQFPLFTVIYKIAFLSEPAISLVEVFMTEEPRVVVPEHQFTKHPLSELTPAPLAVSRL